MGLRRSLLLLGLACHIAAASSGSFFLHPQPPLPLFERSESEEPPPPPALPELDGCQRAVLGELTLSCSDLSEEHLSKLGMALFNCRAAAEHRPTYPCTPGMALSDCTQGMDAATRKAYLMVRNHARALCHADRQQHLRPRAETTTNCSAHEPACLLEVMNILKDGQAELRELTAASLEKLVNSQKLLLQQQEQLEAWRQDVESSINANLEKLAQGRAVPAGGHQLIAELIEGITLTVDNVSEQLVHQDLQLHQGQQTILAHLLEVGARLHQLDTKLEWKLALFAAHQSQTAVHHEQLEKLQKMNETVRHVLGHLEQGESLRMNTLQHFLNWTGRDLHVMYTCVVHTSCFLAAAIIMTFLQTPGFSRAVLLVLVLLNALFQLNHCASLDLTSLSAFLTLTVVGNWMLINCFGCRMRTSVWTPVLLRSQRPGFFTSTPERKCAYSEWGEEGENMDHDSLQGKGSPHGTAGNNALESACFIRGSPLTPAPVETVQPTTNPVAYSFKVPAPLMALLPLQNPPPLPNCAQWEAAEKNTVGENHRLQHHTSVFEAETFVLHDSAGSTGSLSRRLPCCGITRTGQQCRNKAASGREFCRVHGSEQTLACR
ncbi:protein brambleberry-like isoform X3 [Leucoraja erinacea]|uniref:protein brambleberry-like isoform X3 n=1 Tax=Leucoraja erinaceus TaxID=7782 RepID=UPI002457B9C4|nr:protein brambleberry-like isoform X3 [Leucoraja erinacea]